MTAYEIGYKGIISNELMLDINGFGSTCNATNFFMVKNGEVWTSNGQYCMNGITRGRIIEICNEKKSDLHQKNS